MDYKKLIEELKSILPEKVLYGDLIGAEGIYAHSGPLVYEDPESYSIEQAIIAITDLFGKVEQLQKENAELLKRAEAAEARAENVALVVQARWTNHCCTACGKQAVTCTFSDGSTVYIETPRCPACGAMMNEEA